MIADVGGVVRGVFGVLDKSLLQDASAVFISGALDLAFHFAKLAFNLAAHWFILLRQEWRCAPAPRFAPSVFSIQSIRSCVR